MVHSCLFVDLYTEVPDFCCFHLGGFQASKQLWRNRQSIDMYSIHSCLLALLLFLNMLFDSVNDLAVSRSFIVFCNFLESLKKRWVNIDRKSLRFHTGNIPQKYRFVNRARFHPNPLEGDGTSRVPFVKKQ